MNTLGVHAFLFIIKIFKLIEQAFKSVTEMRSAPEMRINIRNRKTTGKNLLSESGEK